MCACASVSVHDDRVRPTFSVLRYEQPMRTICVYSAHVVHIPYIRDISYMDAYGGVSK